MRKAGLAAQSLGALPRHAVAGPGLRSLIPRGLPRGCSFSSAGFACLRAWEAKRNRKITPIPKRTVRTTEYPVGMAVRRIRIRNERPRGKPRGITERNPGPAMVCRGRALKDCAASRFPHLLFMEKGASPRSAFMLPSKENPMATCYPRRKSRRGQARGLTAGYSNPARAG